MDGEAFRSVCLSARLSLCLCRYGEKEDEGEGQLGGVGSSSSSTWLSSTFLATEQPVKINWHKHGPVAAAVSVLYVAHLGQMIQYSPEGSRERRQRVFGVQVGGEEEKKNSPVVLVVAKYGTSPSTSRKTIVPVLFRRNMTQRDASRRRT